MIVGLTVGFGLIAACYTIAWSISFADRQDDITDELAYGDWPHIPVVTSLHDGEA